MERLTEWYDDGISKGVLVKEEYGEQTLKTLFEESDEGYRGMCTLKAYEDTGLTPEQIIELKYRNNEEEISETQSYGVYFYECPICNEPVHEKDNFCCKCGQRLKRRD